MGLVGMPVLYAANVTSRPLEMKSTEIILTAFVLSLVLSACGGSSDSETGETASSPDETAVSSGGETSEDTTKPDESEGQAPDDGDTGSETPAPVVAPPPAPVTPSPTKPAEPTKPTEPEPTKPVEPPQETPDTDSQPPADDPDPVDPAPPEPELGAAVLSSATVSGSDILLRWEHDFAVPEGGYDIVIDGLDLGDDRTSATSATISGLDLTERHCFIIEARYTDSSTFPRSNQRCTEAQQAANQAPSISGSPATSVDAGDAYVFAPAASDGDDDTLTFSVANLPSWAGFNSADGTLSGTPGAQDVGDYNNIRISVSDGTDTADLAAFSIRVNSMEPAATTGSMSLRWAAPSTRTDGSSLSLSEIDGYCVYIGTTPDNLQMHIDLSQGDLTNYTVDNLEVGNYYVAVTAYDRLGNTSDLSNIVQKSVVN